MFDIDIKLFTGIMLKIKDKNITILKHPNKLETIIYVFNQTHKLPKYTIMKNNIYASNFAMPEIYKDMETLFYLSQKTYWNLQLFAMIWKRKRIDIHNTTNIMLTPLSSFKPNSLIVLYDNHKQYLFHLPDLYNIIVEALTHCSHDYFLEIKKIKNPYTNLPFNVENIYKIYIAFIFSTYKIPILFQCYIESNCNKEVFMQIYEPLIREHCIQYRFKNITNIKCVKIIRSMLRDTSILPNNIKKNFLIHKEFPWQPFIFHFKPFAILYHKVKYGLNPYSKMANKTILMKKLHLFIKENPCFGRKYVYAKQTNDNSYFEFGKPSREPFNTTVKTPFNDMTPDKLKNIRYIHNERTPTVTEYNTDEDSSDNDAGIEVD